jgi:hypothetical protein
MSELKKIASTEFPGFSHSLHICRAIASCIILNVRGRFEGRSAHWSVPVLNSFFISASVVLNRYYWRRFWEDWGKSDNGLVPLETHMDGPGKAATLLLCLRVKSATARNQTKSANHFGRCLVIMSFVIVTVIITAEYLPKCSCRWRNYSCSVHRRWNLSYCLQQIDGETLFMFSYKCASPFFVKDCDF